MTQTLSVGACFPPPAGRLHRGLEVLPIEGQALVTRVAAAGGRALVVGGYVRDAILDQTPGDVDLEVYGIDPLELERMAHSISGARAVGRDFGILKAGPLDVSLPRADRVPGREGFLAANPYLLFQEAARRRDFTVNALAWDPLQDEVFDAWGGLEDLRARVLRPVDPETFGEDPLRALRAVRFLARPGWQAAQGTYVACSRLTEALISLPSERLFEELRKLFLVRGDLGTALDFAVKTGIWPALFPEILPHGNDFKSAIISPERSPGYLWHRARAGLSWLASRGAREEIEEGESNANDKAPELEVPGLPILDADAHVQVAWALLLAPLDPAPETLESLRSRSDAPPITGLIVTVPGRFTGDKRWIQSVGRLVTHRLLPDQLEGPDQARDVARLLLRVPMDALCVLAQAWKIGEDGEGSVEEGAPAALWRSARHQSAPAPIVQGRHLLEWGLNAGPSWKPLLEKLFLLQLEGRLESLGDARRWLEAWGTLPSDPAGPPSEEGTG